MTNYEAGISLDKTNASVAAGDFVTHTDVYVKIDYSVSTMM